LAFGGDARDVTLIHDLHISSGVSAASA